MIIRLTPGQKRIAQAIVIIFETGRALPDYSRVTLLPGDRGHLSYGRTQFSLASGCLYLAVKEYVAQREAAFAERLAPYLAQLAARDCALNTDLSFRALLSDAGRDPAMIRAQDNLTDRLFWLPALRAADALGLSEALSAAVVYDSFVHGGWARMRRRTLERCGTPENLTERRWIQSYLAQRLEWLTGHSNPLLPYTAYRVRSLRKIAGQDNWRLEPPLIVRGVRIDGQTAAARPPVAGPVEENPPLLRRTDPPMRSDYVSRVAQALGLPDTDRRGFDHVFEEAVRAFQAEHGLIRDGIVGPATRAALGF